MFELAQQKCNFMLSSLQVVVKGGPVTSGQLPIMLRRALQLIAVTSLRI